MPKASARGFHQSNRPRLVNALLALRKHSRVLRHRRAFADCFGANPVASALGSSTRRDPGAADRTYHGWSRRPLKTGTFYFAGKRNFLLCLDIFRRELDIRFRAAARTRRPPQVPVSPIILPGHGSAHAARHMNQGGTRPNGRSRRPPPAWRPQSMVRLPGVMAPGHELPVGAGGDARDTRCGPWSACRRCVRCRHTVGRTAVNCAEPI